ncbi:MAG: glycosyltransferase [Actinomycetes bacterium]
MKIVHIANFYGPNSGGIKTTLHELGKGYQSHGHEFIYIVPGTGRHEETTIFGRKITVPGIFLPGSGGYKIIRSNRELKKLILELQPDRLEISDRFTLISIGKWARTRGISAVAFSHETLTGLANKYFPSLPARGAVVNWHNRRFARNFDAIITTTAFAAQEFRSLELDNLVQVPLGVDLENFSPKFRSESLRRELLKGCEFLIVHCGRLSPEKDPLLSIYALAELRKRGVNARLVVIGIGPMWQKFRMAAKGLPVETLGYIADRKRVATILASADVVLAPGPLETFCLAALEALASGTPVVASNRSAVGEFLNLSQRVPAGAVASSDPDEFADAIESLLGRNECRWAARSAAEKLPWQACVQQMLKLHNIPTITTPILVSSKVA